jgi:hypothetical protein
MNLLYQFDEAPLQPLHIKAAIISGVGWGPPRCICMLLIRSLAHGCCDPLEVPKKQCLLGNNF